MPGYLLQLHTAAVVVSQQLEEVSCTTGDQLVLYDGLFPLTAAMGETNVTLDDVLLEFCCHARPI